MTKQYRHQLRLRAQGKCPGCQDPVERFIYCLFCRLERNIRVQRWRARNRQIKAASRKRHRTVAA